VSATAGCASSGTFLQLGTSDSKRPPNNRANALPELGIAKTATRIEPEAAPAPPPKGQYASLERQLHLIAENRLDVTRDQAEGLLAEIQAQRMLARAALDDAAEKLQRRRVAELEDPALRRLREVASVSQDARGTVLVLPSLRWFSAQSAELSPEAKAELAEIARALTELDASGPISIEARPDTLDGGSQLSQQRALSIRGYLIGWGISKDRLTAWSREAHHESSPDTQRGDLEIVLGNRHAKGTSARTP